MGRFLSSSPTGVVPQSGTQYAVFNVETRALTTSSYTGITVENDDSTTKSFSVDKFYYACAVASQEGLIGVPASCTVTATGYDAQGKQVAKQSFGYDVVAAKQGMMLAQPGNAFKGLYKVVFNQKPSLTSVALVGLLDSIGLTTCTS